MGDTVQDKVQVGRNLTTRGRAQGDKWGTQYKDKLQVGRDITNRAGAQGDKWIDNNK